MTFSAISQIDRQLQSTLDELQQLRTLRARILRLDCPAPKDAWRPAPPNSTTIRPPPPVDDIRHTLADNVEGRLCSKCAALLESEPEVSPALKLRIAESLRLDVQACLMIANVSRDVSERFTHQMAAAELNVAANEMIQSAYAE